MSMKKLEELRNKIRASEEEVKQGITVNITVNNTKLLESDSLVSDMSKRFNKIFVLGWNLLSQEEEDYLSNLINDNLAKNLKAAGLQLESMEGIK